MTELEQTTAFYSGIGIPIISNSGIFLPPGRFGADNYIACQYVAFYSADGNRVTHYFTTAGAYWCTTTGNNPLT